MVVLLLWKLPAVAKEEDHVAVGIGSAALPRFQGSEDYRAEPVPLVDIKQWRFFAKTGDGIGLNLYEGRRVTVGASVSWMQGYDEDDVPEGIGELDSELGGRVFISTELYGITATVSGTQALSEEERGLIATARIAYPYQLTERFLIVSSIAANWGDEQYMNSYFGVDGTRAANSGLPLYEPSAGFKDVSLRLAFRYELSADWGVGGAIEGSQLMNTAYDSPFVETKTQARALVGVTYRF
ncbi:MipA/OmpV family protein [Marinobacter nanhaiticus]|uniref:MipA/OmpV family protein n=1 Tax=Marinobacter nanhaiticus TaxID=1305740 RepID=UPI0002CC2E33|nr:MipA/OmpV family protein [Marinobacter nanhaiticus]